MVLTQNREPMGTIEATISEEETPRTVQPRQYVRSQRQALKDSRLRVLVHITHAEKKIPAHGACQLGQGIHCGTPVAATYTIRFSPTASSTLFCF